MNAVVAVLFSEVNDQKADMQGDISSLLSDHTILEPLRIKVVM